MKVYWTMKNGQQIDVDKMDINHLRNTLKMLIRNSATLTKTIQIYGEIDQSYLHDYDYDYGIDEVEHF